MSRSREFDPHLALEKSMLVFWEKGYSETSIDDLVAATGVSRYGLYGEFGNKRELFLACLDQYQKAAVDGLFGSVEQAGAGLAEIKTYFNNVVEAYSQAHGKLGCLMCNTATEVLPHDKGVGKKIKSAIQRITTGLKVALGNAQAAGELRDGLDIQETADFLTGVLLGISVMARSGANKNMIANSVAMSLAAL